MNPVTNHRIEPHVTTTIGLLLIGLYAAIHVGLTLARWEQPLLGILAGIAFVLLEYTSAVNLVLARSWGLGIAAAVTYAFMLASLGGLRELYFGAEASWFSSRALAWWATACGAGAAAQLAFALRANARQADAQEAQERAHAHEMDALERQLRSEERRRRAELREETKRQAMEHTPIPAVALGESTAERRLRLAAHLERTPQVAIADIAHLYPVSASTLRKDAHLIGFECVDGAWQRNGGHGDR